MRGVVTGIERRRDGGEDAHRLAIAVEGGAQRSGVRIAAPWLDRIHLGTDVALRAAADDDPRPVIDAGDAVQLPLDEPPPDGVTDLALDRRVRKALDAWPRARATIGPITPRRMVLGWPTKEAAIDLVLADGRVTRAAQQIPPYAAFLATPGTEVPIAVDPRRPERAYVDWAAAANEAAAR